MQNGKGGKMKKLFAIAIAASMLSGLYGLTLGLGVAYEDVAEDGRWLCIKGDARIPIIPVLDWRAELITVRLPENAMSLHIGTGISSDLLVKIPVPAPISPYLAFGFLFDLGLEDEPLDYMNFKLKAGAGAEYSFGPACAYIEGGLHNLDFVKDREPDEMTTAIYAQLGVTYPIPLGL